MDELIVEISNILDAIGSFVSSSTGIALLTISGVLAASIGAYYTYRAYIHNVSQSKQQLSKFSFDHFNGNKRRFREWESRWSRVIAKVPIQEQLLNELSGILQEIQTSSQSKYQALLEARSSPPSEIDPDRVRVNVFLPDTRHVQDGEVCSLHIPSAAT